MFASRATGSIQDANSVIVGGYLDGPDDLRPIENQNTPVSKDETLVLVITAPRGLWLSDLQQPMVYLGVLYLLFFLMQVWRDPLLVITGGLFASTFPVLFFVDHCNKLFRVCWDARTYLFMSIIAQFLCFIISLSFCFPIVQLLAMIAYPFAAATVSMPDLTWTKTYLPAMVTTMLAKYKRMSKLDIEKFKTNAYADFAQETGLRVRAEFLDYYTTGTMEVVEFLLSREHPNLPFEQIFSGPRSVLTLSTHKERFTPLVSPVGVQGVRFPRAHSSTDLIGLSGSRFAVRPSASTSVSSHA